MLSWFVNPWMLLGGLAVASPILIHLLNKRRFKIVDWAAMDFLFEADKKNRRRVQLENFILLMLRCLAMLLIALMLARPFLPSSLTRVMQQAQVLERVIVIDDSLSQRVLRDSRPSFESAQKATLDLMSRLADSDQTEDWLTVILTSQPDEPVLANEPLTRNTLANLAQTIEDLRCTDGAADYAATLEALQRYVSGPRETGGRAVYLFTDLRQRDWLNSADGSTEGLPNARLNEIAEATEACLVIDTGGPEDDNLSITGIRPASLQVAGKVIPFIVTLANRGESEVNQVRVMLQVDEGQPEYETLPSIGPGETRELTFRYVFPERAPDESLLNPDAQSTAAGQFRNYRVRAEIDRQSLSEAGLKADQLIEDSGAYYASRVSEGVSVLLVDGDPSAISERSETHYLKALGVAGTGLAMQVIAATELETVSLSDYQVIFLCNVDEASPDRIRSLRQWVEDGGALVFMPGNRVRAQTFNDAFYQDGQGLSPVRLDAITGDPTMSKWVNFEVDAQVHPALRVIIDSDATSLSNVDVFSWWLTELTPNVADKLISVPLRLSDEKSSPAMVDRDLGDGNVVVFTIPGDGDWSMWPSSPTFPPVMIELIDYLIGSRGDASLIELGGALSYPVDLTAYQNRVALRDPANEKIEAVAAPVGGDPQEGSSVLYRVTFDQLDRSGFYDLQLTRHDGETESVLFATNVDAEEGQLTRMTAAELDGNFFNDQVRLVQPETLADETVSGGNSEIWHQLLWLLFLALMLEQFLGWFWGRKR